MKRRILIIALIFTILFPFLINLFGYSIYAYLNFGERDLIFASACGVSHNAWAKHYEDEGIFGMESADEFTTTILDVGFLNLFLERRGEQMTPFTFRWIEAGDADYRRIEFPWLLLLLAPLTIAVIPRLTRMQNKRKLAASSRAESSV